MTDEEKFIESLYEEANEQLKEVYKDQKNVRDELLKEIALIMLTYTILDGIMSIGKNDKDKSYKKLSILILNGHKSVGKNQIDIISKTLNSTVKKTFDFYSYNANLKDVKKIIDNNFKGKHFSERVWENENEVAKHLHKQVNDFLNGKINVNQIKKDIEKTYNTSAYNSKRLVETEVNRCEDEAFRIFCKEVGVKKVRRNEVLDRRTCEECASLDGKIYYLDEAPGVVHPLCRGFNTVEY
jgi:SPP1 gp7 family putative phage head morphogenesis protein